MSNAVLAGAYAGLLNSWQALSDEQRTELLGEFALTYAYNSGKIENDQISYHDTREVFEAGRVVSFTGEVRTLFEIQNLKQSWDWALEQTNSGLVLNEELVLEAHGLLTAGTYDEKRWAAGERPGSYKLGDYVVGVNDVGATAAEAPKLMAELLEEVNDVLAHQEQALTLAAYLHARIVDIHPFADGNGRVARLLMNMLLLALNNPPIAIREEDRMAYYGALDAFHGEGNLEALKDFLIAEAVKSWESLLRSK